MEQKTTPKVLVTVETHKRLKVLAAQHGVSMGDMIRLMHDKWVIEASREKEGE